MLGSNPPPPGHCINIPLRHGKSNQLYSFLDFELIRNQIQSSEFFSKMRFDNGILYIGRVGPFVNCIAYSISFAAESRDRALSSFKEMLSS